jgi:hypothetical protein
MKQIWGFCNSISIQEIPKKDNHESHEKHEKKSYDRMVLRKAKINAIPANEHAPWIPAFAGMTNQLIE